MAGAEHQTGKVMAIIDYVFCPVCGTRLGMKVVGDEGEVPFCAQCGRPYFRPYPTCVIVTVLDETQNVILLRKHDVSQTNHVLVAGYIKYGDSAEDTVVKEVAEETGQHVERVRYLRSYVHERRGLLMLGFAAFVRRRPITFTGEVDEAAWFPLAEAPALLRGGSIAERHLLLVKDLLAAGAQHGGRI